MKTLLLTFALCIPTLLFAQSNIQGTATYKETVQMNIQPQLPEGTEESIIIHSKLPKSRSLVKQLLFTATESVYKNKTNQDENAPMELEPEDGMVVKMVFAGDNNRLYQNIPENKLIEQTEFMGRPFRIVEDRDQMSWKLTSEKKTILNYECIKAILNDTSRAVEAWFTMQIPAAFGPADYRGLPGLILEVSVDDGQRQIQASEVKLEEIAQNSIKIPEKGKEVSRAQFRKIRDKKVKEMQESYGGKGNIIIQRF